MNLGKMMKDPQKMQAKLQTEIDAMEVEASSGGGIVTARMNGKKELLDLILAADAITPDDPELLQDLVIAAVNEAGRKVDAEVQQKTQGMMPGLKIPGLG
jgi:DNA-binding YbaB/EbfC family protein